MSWVLAAKRVELVRYASVCSMVILLLLVTAEPGRAAGLAPGCEDGDDGARDHCCPLISENYIGFDKNDAYTCLALLPGTLA